ncbi:MAG: cysteine desulfurase [Puniceicoccales bacterium]|jgi:cysteine desulfurase/selenocysteine lyase|nr:cysteine desulfurase [Puniceicoccales bacterium]
MKREFSVENFREQFPILHKPLKNGKRLVYLDNSATTQKPQCVIDRIVEFYSQYNSNVHRGMYEFSERATGEYESARLKVANYFGVKNPDEIVFVSGATDAINLVAYGYGRKFLAPGDEVLIGAAEHHANYLPWQVLEREIGIVRKIIPLDGNGDIDMEAYENLFSSRTKLVAIQHIGNVIGAVNDIKNLAKIAHANGAKILVDGACSMASGKVNLSDVDCDFFACSGHKGFAPTGSGFLFGKYELLSEMSPHRTGGNAVIRVTFQETTFKPPPAKFEAGTQNISAVIGLGEAVAFLDGVDWESARRHMATLADHCREGLRSIGGITTYGAPKNQTCLFSFNLNGVHAHDVATYLGNSGIAVRAGTHCAQPLMQILGVPGTVRISMGLYNTIGEIDVAIDTIENCRRAFIGN